MRSLFPLLHWTKGDTLMQKLLQPHLMIEILEYVAVELFGVVDCYLLRHSKTTFYVCQKNLFSPAAAMLTRGFTSIHFVKNSTATTAYL
jgi:hypothetical protein